MTLHFYNMLLLDHVAQFRLGACADSEVDSIYEEAAAEAHYLK